MALLDDNPELDLYDREWLIHTRSEERAPAKIGPTAQVHRSMISHGCVINGTVVNSVLSPGVRVDVGAVVRDSIVMFDTVIRTGAVVDRAILDKEVVVGQGAIVGDGPDFDTPNKQEPGRLNTGITVVGKQSVVPRGTRLGRNVKVGERVKSTDFAARTVRSGGTVDRKPRASRADAGSDADEPPARVTAGSGCAAGRGRGDRRTRRQGLRRRSRVDCPPCHIAPGASACAPADVEAWLGELGLAPTERADRESVTSWDLVLDGRRRARLRVTVILDPSLALICWAHYAPPINDSFRKSYRKLLRWNDELPFVKFSIGEDERPLLVAEIPVAHASVDALGLALARHLAVADRYHADTVEWLKAGGWSTDPPSPAAGRRPRRPARRPLRAGPGRAAGPRRRAARDGRGSRPDASAAVTALAIALAPRRRGSRRGPGGAGRRARRRPGPHGRHGRHLHRAPGGRRTSGWPWRSPRATARPRRGPAGSTSTTPSSPSSPARPTCGSRVRRAPASRWPGGPRTRRCCGSTSGRACTAARRRRCGCGFDLPGQGQGRQPAGPGRKQPRHAARLGVRVRRSPRQLGQRARSRPAGTSPWSRASFRAADTTADGGTVLAAGPLAAR